MGFRSTYSLTPILCVFLGLALLPSCSDNGTAPIKGLAPLVGVWEAQALTVSDPDNPSQEIDLVEQGGSYALSILSTGQYTAVFDLLVAQGFQAGEVSLSGDQVILTPTSPPGSSTSGTWMFQGDLLIVEAVAVVDLNEDGTDDPIAIRFEFVAREG